MTNKLQLIQSKTETSIGIKPTRASRKAVTQATYETAWHKNPEQFCTKRHCLEKIRVDRTKSFIKNHSSLNGSYIVDLGCGDGEITRFLANQGARVDAVDIANNALNKLNGIENIKPIHDMAPTTLLEDNIYDLVIACDLIAYLDHKDHRLLISELVRLVKRDGKIIFSTPIDIYTLDALENVIKLAETELEIELIEASYHKLFIQLLDLFKVAGRITIPVVKQLKKSTKPMLWLEKLCRTVSQEDGINHVIFVAKVKPLEF